MVNELSSLMFNHFKLRSWSDKVITVISSLISNLLTWLSIKRLSLLSLTSNILILFKLILESEKIFPIESEHEEL